MLKVYILSRRRSDMTASNTLSIGAPDSQSTPLAITHGQTGSRKQVGRAHHK
jgi:hypothetical protein